MAVANSRTVDLVGGLRLVFGRAMESSSVRRGLRWFRGRSFVESIVSRGEATSRSIRHATTGSYLYRWLTTEPEPEVIVIDLRETWTVGPIIAFLDSASSYAVRSPVGARLISKGAAVGRVIRTAPLRAAGLVGIGASTGFAVGGLIRSSLPVVTLSVLFLALSLLAYRDDRSWDELAETRTVQLLAAVFAPPPQPTDTSEGSPDRKQ